MRIAVLGAGIQGCCAALELAGRGFDVDLFDREAMPLQQASVQNEGKIHLGFVFAKDASRGTARLMMNGALQFRRLLARHVPAEAFATAAPFDYVVMSDSMLTVDEVADHFTAVEEIYRELRAADPEVDYLGRRPDVLSSPLPLSSIDGLMHPGLGVAAYRTEELAIEVNVLAAALSAAAAAHPSIRFRGGHLIQAVERAEAGFVVKGATGDRTWAERFPQVVNALWESRLAIDASVGIPLPARWNYRLKLRILCEFDHFPRADRSFTMVLGPYGDIVHYGDGTTYVTWYPVSLKGWSTDLLPPVAWDKFVRRQFSRDEELALAREMIAVAARDWIPALAEAKIIDLGGGIIVGDGELDIGHNDSALHRRTETGVFSVGGYHSVSTGKYTTAPMFAAIAADRVLAAASGG